MIKEKLSRVLIRLLEYLGYEVNVGIGLDAAAIKALEAEPMSVVDALDDVRQRTNTLFDEAVRNRLSYYSELYEKNLVFNTLLREYPWVGPEILSAIVEGVILERAVSFH